MKSLSIFESNYQLSQCLQRFKAQRCLIAIVALAISSCQNFAQINQRLQSRSELQGQIWSKGVVQCGPTPTEPYRDLFKPTLPSEFTIEYYLEGVGGSYFFPTELDPEPLHQELVRLKGTKKSQKSVQIAVGTERGFLTAVADSLILADTNELVRLYNFINIGLLKAAKDVKTYRNLRFAQSIDIWKNHNVVFETEIDQKILFAFWTIAQKEQSLKILGHPPNLRVSSTASRIPLDNDYVWNNERFLKLHQMAIQDKIFVYHIDLTKKNEVKDLIDLINKNALDLLFVDLSNIHAYVNLSSGLLDTMLMFKASHIIISQIHTDVRGRIVPRLPMSEYKVFRYYIMRPNSNYRFTIDHYVKKGLPKLRSIEDHLVEVL